MLYAPPVNFLTIFLIPCLFNKELMLRGSERLSKIIFWLENVVYITGFFVYEVMLAPYIYIRLIYNIIAVADFKNALGLVVVWVPFGPFFLTYGVVKDICNYY